jgi:hypothetical protein
MGISLCVFVNVTLHDKSTYIQRNNRDEILIAAIISIVVFGVEKPHRLVDGYHCFRGTHKTTRRHNQNDHNRHVRKIAMSNVLQLL